MDTFDTIIGQNVKLHGNLTNQGAIQINGSVEGEVESGSAIIIGPGSVIKGHVKAKVIEISGEVHGPTFATDRIEIHTKGKLYGDATTRNLVVKMGAIFVGKSDLLSDDAKSDTDPEKTL